MPVTSASVVSTQKRRLSPLFKIVPPNPCLRCTFSALVRHVGVRQRFVIYLAICLCQEPWTPREGALRPKGILVARQRANEQGDVARLTRGCSRRR